jgi:hypothetical protein
MANIPIDPQPFVPQGYQIQNIAGRLGVKRVVVPRRPKEHEQYAIATITPFPEGLVPFQNVRDVLEEYFTEVARVGFVSLHSCPFGAAYVQFRNVSDRDRLIASSPNQFGDVHISFVKHDEGVNWRGVTFNRDVWLLLVGPPLDHMTTEDLNACFADIGSLLLWEKDPNRKGRVLVKVRVTDLMDIPKSIRMTESSRPEAQSWTFLVEILLDNLLGGGPADKDPLPDDGVDPHPLPGHALPVPQNPAPVIPAVQNDPDNLDGWGHWAMGAEQEQPQPMEVEEQELIQQEEMVLDDQQLGPPLLDANSFVNVSSSSSEGSATHDPQPAGGPSCGPISQAQAEVSEQQMDQPILPLGEGLLNILQAYSSQDDSLPDISEKDSAGSSMLGQSSQVLTSEDDDFFSSY